MIDKSLEQRVSYLEREKEFEKKEHEEENRQCKSHNERTAELEDFIEAHKIEHVQIKNDIEGKASKEALKDLKSGWIGHVIQAAIAIVGFLLLYLKTGGAK